MAKTVWTRSPLTHSEKSRRLYETTVLMQELTTQLCTDLQQMEIEGISTQGVHAWIQGTYAPIRLVIPDDLLLLGSEVVSHQVLEAFKSAYHQANLAMQTSMEQITERCNNNLNALKSEGSVQAGKLERQDCAGI